MPTAKVTDFVERMIETRKRFEEEARPIIHEYIKGFFKDHPDVTLIRWRQYIPAFNDGDPCTFTLSEPLMVVKGFDGDEEFEYDGNDYYGVTEYSDGIYQTPKAEWFDEFETFLYQMEEYIQSLYGNDVTVYCTPEKITTDEYDCGY